MKKKTIILLAAIFSFISFTQAQNARLQAIHNCPDPGAATVDVWLSFGGNSPVKILPDFDYKEASPFVDVPAMTNITVSITAPGSMDTTMAVFHKDFNLPSNSTNIVVASGGLAETGAMAFDLRAYAGMEMATNMGAMETSVKVIHGSYDAPEVDILEVQIPAGEIVPDLEFGEGAGYLDLPSTDFDIQVNLQNGMVFKEFDVDLTMFADSAVAVVATGYADPSMAVGSEPFGLLAVFPDGTVAQLPEKPVTPARVQAIHNCPDPGAATVDVWLSYDMMPPVKLVPNFDYKTATPFIDAPAGTELTISITAPMSMDTSGAVFHGTYMLPSNATAVLVASGGLAETGATAFDLRAYGGMEMATNTGNGEISVKAIHGSYDAPMVDIHEVQIPAGELISDLDFGADAGYIDLAAADYDLQVKLQTGEAFKQFDADLSMFEDSAVVVVATGYVDPSMAVGTEDFGLLAVFPDGTVAELMEQTITPARLQVIHNSAAADADSVDVWLNDGPMPLLDDFKFRHASPFIDAPAGEFFDVSIALPTSMDTTGALYKETFILESNKKYIVIASGNVGSGMYSPSAPFELVVIPDAREMSMDPAEVDVLVYHGSTDAPMVDVNELTVPVNDLVTDLEYTDYSMYLELAEMDYELEVEAAAGIVATYSAPLQTLGLAGNAITVVASGYVDPSMNENGAPFGLWVALPSGGMMVELTTVLGLEREDIAENIEIYPNPVIETLNINLENKYSDLQRIEIINGMGQIIRSENVETYGNDARVSINVNDLSEGRYFVLLRTSDSYQTFDFVKTK